VAHDFNNLLSIITSAGAILHEDLGPEHPSAPMTLEIREACRRATELTRQLLAFSRKQMLMPGPVNANELIATAAESARAAGGASLKVVVEPAPEPWTLRADA